MARKFKRVFVHFGADKTGSTAIQSALDGARQTLLDSSLVAYPPGFNHGQLGSCFSDTPEHYIFNVEMGFVDTDHIRESDASYIDRLRQWIDEVPACESLIFSFEGFGYLDENALGKLRTFCGSLADSVSAIAYVRAPLSYAVSAISQRVKQGRQPWPDNLLPISNYVVLLDRIIRAFGKESIHVRPFAPEALKNGCVVEDFAALVGIPNALVKTALKSSIPSNQALSLPAYVFGDALRRMLLDKGFQLNDVEFNSKYGQYLASIPGKKIRITAAQIEQVIAASRSHSQYLEDHFGIVFHEDPCDFLLRPIDALNLQEEDLVRSTAKVLVDVITNSSFHRPDFSEPGFTLILAELSSEAKVDRGQVIVFTVKFSIERNFEELAIGIHIFDSTGRLAFGTNTALLERPVLCVRRGTHRFRYCFVADLPEGAYTIGFGVTERVANGYRDIAWYDKLTNFTVSMRRPLASVGYMGLPVEFDYLQVDEGAHSGGLGPLTGGRCQSQCDEDAIGE